MKNQKNHEPWENPNRTDWIGEIKELVKTAPAVVAIFVLVFVIGVFVVQSGVLNNATSNVDDTADAPAYTDDASKDPQQDHYFQGNAPVYGGPNEDGSGAKDPTRDPAYSTYASIGGGVNVDDDGPGEYQPIDPSVKPDPDR